jgi:hypothetical protein
MRVAITIGVGVVLCARALVKHRASARRESDNGVSCADTTPPPTDALVVYLDAYRRRRASTLGYRRAGDTAS